MKPCPACGETIRMIRMGTTTIYIMPRPGRYEWVEGRTWMEAACAACGEIIEQAYEPLDSPEESRPRAIV